VFSGLLPAVTSLRFWPQATIQAAEVFEWSHFRRRTGFHFA
jgi:hypothetical protein